MILAEKYETGCGIRYLKKTKKLMLNDSGQNSTFLNEERIHSHMHIGLFMTIALKLPQKHLEMCPF
jgi:hypothetical protein